MNSAMLKEAAYALKEYYNNADEIVESVISHALGAAIAAAGAGGLPGAGSTIAAGIAIGIIVKMYVSLGKMLGVKLGNGILKSLASAVVADLAGAVVASIAVSTVLSFIPGIGTLGSAVITGITSFCYVYLAGIIYIKMLGSLLNNGKNIDGMSEAELKQAMKSAANSIDLNDAIKEAKNAYKENK